MKIQPGYRVVPVLTEPFVHEPSVITWDGNGRMYVVEMRTYMQDIDGTNKLAPVSRVSRHEDTNADGVYDKHTVFADNLVLPRMVLPLLDRVIIGETNTLDLKSYQDTNDDGVADKIDVCYVGGHRGGNLEHQPSGLIWNIDNWIYTTYTNSRYRYSDGQVAKEPLIFNTGQWGLTHDNVGRLFFSIAGGEIPALNFQQPVVYGQISLAGELTDGFRDVFPIDNIPDTQGGLKRLRSNNTLNRFTGGGGQSIYRGNQMPSDFDGNLILCEPVGRLIRRAEVTESDGRITLANVYQGEEFIAATDPNFRPVNSATGPDGCLYIVDMYRGIIQEGNWVREGSYLRGVVQDYELDKNIGRGRIYRVEHETTRRGQRPKMLDETPAQLIRHLSHPNGWWRSEAQKLIVLHGNRDIAPVLAELAHHGKTPLGRLHAYWTLDGLGAITPQILSPGFTDSDDRVRAAAMRIAEPMMATDRSLDTLITQLGNDRSPTVVIQTLLSINHGKHPDAESLTRQILKTHADVDSITSIAQQYKANQVAILAEQKKMAELANRNKALAESVMRGKTIYSTLCTTCHGENGKGHPSPKGDNLHLAPPLAGSLRVTGHKERLARILLHGLIGPIDNKTYSDGLMMPLAANNDRWIADAANYVRNSWGNRAAMIAPDDIARVRSESQSRIGPWTIDDLAYFDPPPLTNQSQWKLSASLQTDNTSAAIDGDTTTRWSTGKHQASGQWLAIELPEPLKVMTLELDTRKAKTDFPRGYVVHVSQDGKTWTGPVAKGYGDGPITLIEIDSPGRVSHLRITQTGSSRRSYWSVYDLKIRAIPSDATPPVSLAESLAKVAATELAANARRDGDARRGAKLFFSQSISCAKCHEPNSGPRLGPNLAQRRTGTTDVTLVEAVLDPSKEIHQDFQQTSVLTGDGLIINGFLVSEDDDTVVLRDPATGKELRIPQDDVEAIKPMKVSAMPPGLVNQLRDRQQFSDLIRFLIEVSQQGESAMTKLRANAK
ncbi:DUF7133 domain-containing protein [Planctomycetes bacterium K23_9]